MLYQFRCRECNYLHEEVFSASQWDKRVTKDSRLKRIKCDGCGRCKLYRSIEKAPEVLGGTNNYQSMERYWERNPELVRAHEDKMAQDNERHKNFKNNAIKRQKAGEQIGPKINQKKK